MTVARTKAVKKRKKAATRAPRPAISSKKTREILGVLLLFVGAFLLFALLSYHPQDPSVFYSGDEGGTRNFMGPYGAQIADVLFRLVGLPALLIPVGLLLAGLRRVRTLVGDVLPGRTPGLLLLVVAIPPLAQLVLGQVTWRGEALRAGGYLGWLISDTLEGRLHFLGALLVLVALLVIGTALALQSGLGEVVGAGASKLSGAGQHGWTKLRVYRARRSKDKARQRVVDKHLERAREKKQNRPELVSERVKADRLRTRSEDAPARVVPRAGEPGPFLRRRSAGASAQTAEPAVESLRERAPSTVHEPQGPLPRRPRLRAKAKDRTPRPAAEEVQQSLPMPKPRIKKGALPPLDLLNLEKTRPTIDEDELVRQGELICQRCAEFGVQGTVEAITPGPVITVFEFQPAPGVKVSRIVNLADDLALSLKAMAIRIDRIPGKSTLGIEVPNPDRSVIRLGPMLADPAFKKAPSPLTMALGQTLHGDPYYADLAVMPHLLVAGATGAGKSVGLQSMITSLLYRATRDQVQFIFIDPKRIELGVYKNIPHLKTEVVVDPKKAANALRWAVGEMERRYKLLAEVNVRSIGFYNQAINDPEVQKRLSLKDEEEGDEESIFTREDLQPLPYYVIIIDELADLMMVASSDVETCLARLAQMARAVGIHLIVATQRPSVDVLTGMIKANFPCRIAYSTASRHDSRTILDAVGAEKLLGKGDALFMPPGTSRIMRLHGAYVSEQETAGVIRWLKRQGPPELDPTVLANPIEESSGSGEAGDASDDPLFDDAARLVVREGKGSASFLQRRMRVGFSRAARLIDMLEQDGILGPAQGSKPREIMVPKDYFEEIDTHE